LYKTLLF